MPDFQSLKVNYIIILLGAIFTCFSSNLLAVNQVNQTPIINAQPGTVGLGFGYRIGNSPYVDIDNISSEENSNSTDLVPLYLYEGKYLFMHGTSAGIHLFNTPIFSLDAIGHYRFDRLEAKASDFYAGMDDRDQTVDGGIALSLRQPWGTLTATAATDLLGKHNGEEYDLTYRYTADVGKWSLSPFISYVYQSRDLTDYYYGVDIDEANPSRPVYQADSDSFFRVGVNTAYQLTEGWSIHANLAYEEVSDEIRDSPLTDEDHLISAFVGAGYNFGDIWDEQRVSEGRKGEWSWRVNAGYTVEETFHQVHRGFFKRSEDVHTSLAGFTLGKLLQDGEKADYWGRVSINRRFENNEQSDFFEYVAYVMAMGTGNSPWTNRELFRYGFGFGFSYADKVPIVEQIKQDRRDRNTGHFLNYLEAQVDVPIQNIFGKNASKNCYVGLTLVHRSGIFGTSDILSNVSGGSDVLTGHLECKR